MAQVVVTGEDSRAYLADDDGQSFGVGFGKGQNVFADALQLFAAEGADDVEVEFEDMSCGCSTCDAMSRKLRCECHFHGQELPIACRAGLWR